LAEHLFLLSFKPVLYAANIAEDDMLTDPKQIPMVKQVLEYAEKEQSEVLVISAQVEEEIAQLDPEERNAFLKELGLPESGLDRLIKRSYHLLGLISFLTAGPKEVRAWTIKQGTRAAQAAGKIHTDFERGFIRAEVVHFDTLVELGSQAAAREKGQVRSEGRDYVVKDGDVILFRFNV
jgi:ribosome-binding ATPase YchF (GTP1/OBG family)